MQPRTERRGPLIFPRCRELQVLSGNIAIRVKHGLGTLSLLPIYKRGTYAMLSSGIPA